MGRLLGRIQPGQRPAQLAQSQLDTPLPAGDKGPPHALEAGIPGHRTAALQCLSLVPPGKASAPMMPQAAPGEQQSRSCRRCGQRMGSACGRAGSRPVSKPQAPPPPAKPMAFPALLWHPHPIAQGTRHGNLGFPQSPDLSEHLPSASR